MWPLELRAYYFYSPVVKMLAMTSAVGKRVFVLGNWD